MALVYKLVFSGRVFAGYSVDEVKTAVKQRLSLGDSKVDAMFSGQKVVLKRGEDVTAVSQYLALMTSLGAETAIETEDVVAAEKTSSQTDNTPVAQTAPRTNPQASRPRPTSAAATPRPASEPPPERVSRFALSKWIKPNRETALIAVVAVISMMVYGWLKNSPASMPVSVESASTLVSPTQSEGTVATAPQASSNATGAEACTDVVYDASCPVNPDGLTCNNNQDPGIFQLVSRGNYQILDSEVNNKGRCVLTLHVEGVVRGNSYSRTFKVWAFKRLPVNGG